MTSKRVMAVGGDEWTHPVHVVVVIVFAAAASYLICK